MGPILIALTGLTSFYIIFKIIQSIQYGQRVKRQGCEPVTAAFIQDPSGISMLLQGIKATRNKSVPQWMAQTFEKVSQEKGRVVGTAKIAMPFFDTGYVTTDPKNIQAILATSFKDYSLGFTRINNFKPLLGNGIFATDGKQWEHSRALLRPQFVRSQVGDVNLEEAHVQTLMKVLDGHRDDSNWTNVVDLQPLFFSLTLDSATEFLFGESVDSQSANIPGASKAAESERAGFAEAFDQSQLTLSIAGRFGKNYWMAHTKEFHRQVKNVHDFIDYFVHKALQQKQNRGDEKDDAEESRYVFLEALAQETSDPVELRSQLLNILLAGRDTTASTLGWFFYTMANPKYKAVFQQLRSVILEDFGTYSNPKNISFESMKNCQYLQWCLNECLRLYPAVPVNGRSTINETILPTGGGVDGQSPILIKAGTDILYSVHLMHRRKDLWGADAEEFKPERWNKRRPGWDYLPFNGGPRICIGQQFALTEVGYVVVRLLQRIDQIDASQVGPESHGLTLTNCPGEGVKLRLHMTD